MIDIPMAGPKVIINNNKYDAMNAKLHRQLIIRSK